MNHPNRGPGAYRFIAWSTITQAAVAHAGTLEDARELAAKTVAPEFIEVLSCGWNGRPLWRDATTNPRPATLIDARKSHPTVHRGTIAAEHTTDTLTWPTTGATDP